MARRPPPVMEAVCTGCGKFKGEPHGENCILVDAASKTPFAKREKKSRSAFIEGLGEIIDPCGESVLEGS